ncbi:unnamed protein product [Ixodes pacificus]
MHNLVFGPVEDGAVHREHGGHGEHFLRAPVLFRGQQHLGHHRVHRELGHAPSQLGQLPHVVQGPQRIQLLQCQHLGVVGESWAHFETRLCSVAVPPNSRENERTFRDLFLGYWCNAITLITLGWS